jgi:hypothetical protein
VKYGNLWLLILEHRSCKQLRLSAASGLIRTMLTVEADRRANIGAICAHPWINVGFEAECLSEAQRLASLTPVRLDLLLAVANNGKEAVEAAVENLPEGVVVVQDGEEEERARRVNNQTPILFLFLNKVIHLVIRRNSMYFRTVPSL